MSTILRKSCHSDLSFDPTCMNYVYLYASTSVHLLNPNNNLPKMIPTFQNPERLVGLFK